MIEFFTGKPGDGKSLFATRQILEDLINTNDFIVTNVPLVPSRVHEYVSKRRDGFNFDERVKILKDDEVYEFYRFRSGGLVLEPSPDFLAKDDGAKRLDRQAFIAEMKRIFSALLGDKVYQLPCKYYIDEAHNFFSAREWTLTGRGLLYYASQHRHLHDNIVFITQVMENVEKQLRGLASETHMMRNHLRRRVGPFRMRPVFKVKSFYGVPSGTTMKPHTESTFHLDPDKVAGCYRTVGAMGIHTEAEKKVNKAPLPWWTMYLAIGVAVAAVGLGLALVPALGASAAAKIATSSKGKILAAAGVPATPQKPAAQAVPEASHINPAGAKEEKQVPFLRSLVVRMIGGAPVIFAELESGGRIDPSTIRRYSLDGFPRPWVESHGVRYYLRSSPSVAPKS